MSIELFIKPGTLCGTKERIPKEREYHITDRNKTEKCAHGQSYFFLTLEILIYFQLKALEFKKTTTTLYSPMQKSLACISKLQRLGLIGNRSDSLITLYLPLITCTMSRARSHGWLILKSPLDEVPKGEIMSKWLVNHIQAFEQSIHTWQLVASLWSLHFLLKCL